MKHTLAHLLLDALQELPTNPFQAPTRRRLPYIYTPAQIVQLVGAANRLRRSYPIRREVYAALLALIAATGLRIAATGRAYSSPLTKALCGVSKSGSAILSAVNSVEFLSVLPYHGHFRRHNIGIHLQDRHLPANLLALMLASFRGRMIQN